MIQNKDFIKILKKNLDEYKESNSDLISYIEFCSRITKDSKDNHKFKTKMDEIENVYKDAFEKINQNFIKSLSSTLGEILLGFRSFNSNCNPVCKCAEKADYDKSCSICGCISNRPKGKKCLECSQIIINDSNIFTLAPKDDIICGTCVYKEIALVLNKWTLKEYYTNIKKKKVKHERIKSQPIKISDEEFKETNPFTFGNFNIKDIGYITMQQIRNNNTSYFISICRIISLNSNKCTIKLNIDKYYEVLCSSYHGNIVNDLKNHNKCRVWYVYY